MRLAYADELAVGLAGEHLVCADLLARGYSPFRTEQSAPYDIAVQVGKRLLRIQVKATTHARPCLQKRQQHVTAWKWSMRRTKRGARAYDVTSIDGFALVALDVRRVAYVKPGIQTLQLAASGSRRADPRTFDDFPFEALLQETA